MLVDLNKSLTKILPISVAEKRPLWSVMIPCHNNAGYLQKTLESILVQYPGSEEMQIMVVDDNSTIGDPEGIVKKIGLGKVSFYRQPVNVGNSRNFDTCIKEAKGKLVHILHEDDCVRDGFYERMSKLFSDFPEIGAAFCRHIFIDEKDNWISISEMEMEENGILENWLSKIAERQRIQYCSMVVKRSVYENLGGFLNKELAGEGWEMSGEDWEMWVRIAANYKVGYLTEPLAEYRIHKSSITGNSRRTGQNIRDLQKIIDILAKYVPDDKIETVKKSGEKHYADYAFDAAKKLLKDSNEVEAAKAQLNEAVIMNPDIINNELDIYLKLNELITYEGVSVILPSHNGSAKIANTINHIARQELPDNLHIEIIFVDNASTDNTYESAFSELKRIKNPNVSYKIIRQPVEGLHEARKIGIDEAKFEYILFFDEETLFEKNYISTAFNLIRDNKQIGIVTSSGLVQSDKHFPLWLNRKLLRQSYGIASPEYLAGDFTNIKKYISLNGSILRKEAWKKIVKDGTIPLLTDQKKNHLISGGDTELSNALRQAGWRIWYEPALKLKHYLPAQKTSWKYLRNLWREFGENSLSNDKLRASVKENNFEIRRTLNKLRKFGNKKLINFRNLNEGDSEIIYSEYYFGRINSLLNKRSQNNSKKTGLLKRAARKSDYKYLRFLYRNFKREISTHGVSVVICCYNSSRLLPETLRHISLQKVRSYVNWEVIVVDNASTDNTAETALGEWSKYKNRSGKLRVVKQPIPGLSAAREKGIEESKYENIVFCDDDNWLDEKYLQTVVSTMRSNNEIAIIGCETEEVCEVKPPEWFEKWKNWSYAVGQQSDKEGDITWSRGFVWGAGMVLRRKALNELYGSGFKSLLTDRKGKELASGGDTELCYALRLAGWRIWYEPALKLKHYITASRLKWEYLLKLWKGFGISTVGLDTYLNSIPEDMIEGNYVVIKKSWKENFTDTINKLKATGFKKTIFRNNIPEGDPDLPLIVHNIARLKELWKLKRLYIERNKSLNSLKWKKDFYYLRLMNRKYKRKLKEDRNKWPWIENESDNSLDNNTALSNLKISVLTPSYNSDEKIEKAILSVCKQGYKNFEHIIVDGGSKDNTLNILKTYSHIKWISEPDKGQSDAMNKAFAMSTGDIICYLNSDDFFQPMAFYNIIDAFNKNSGMDMIVGNLILDFGPNQMIIYPEIEYEKIMQPFNYSFPINPVSYFYKRKVQEECGKFPLDNHYTMDYWFLLRAYQKFRLLKIDDILGTFCLHEINKTASADNEKNTHGTAMDHLKRDDKKNLLSYLYSYYKYKIFRKKKYDSKSNVLRYLKLNNFRRIQFNKNYSDRIFKRACEKTYSYNYLKGFILLNFSMLVYPPSALKQSRRSLLYRSFLGHTLIEKIRKLYYSGIVKKYEVKDFIRKKYYFKRPSFFSAKINSVHYSRNLFSLILDKNSREYSEQFFNVSKDECYNYRYFRGLHSISKSIILSPSTILQKSRRSLFIRLILGHTLVEKMRKSYYSSQVKKFMLKSWIRKKLYNANNFPGRVKSFFRKSYYFFRYREFKIYSENYFLLSQECLLNKKRFLSFFYLMFSLFLYPLSVSRKSRQSLIAHIILGTPLAEKLKGR